jgi:hypothetical protein
MRWALAMAVVALGGCSRSELAARDGGVDAGPPQCTVGRTYVDCGCGCCGGTTPTRRCVYSSRGEDFDAIVEEAQAAVAATNCSVVGCSLGTEYVCCD